MPSRPHINITEDALCFQLGPGKIAVLHHRNEMSRQRTRSSSHVARKAGSGAAP